MVGMIVFTGCLHDILFAHTFDGLNPVDQVLPTMSPGENINHGFGARLDTFHSALCFHQHVALLSFQLPGTEVTVDDTLDLLHADGLGFLHLTHQVGNNDEGCTSSIGKGHAGGLSHLQMMLVDQGVEQSCLGVGKQTVGQV